MATEYPDRPDFITRQFNFIREIQERSKELDRHEYIDLMCKIVKSAPDCADEWKEEVLEILINNIDH